jgi:nucleoside-diphosphate kinase
MDRTELEQTLVLIKPDALQNSLTGYLLSQLSEFHSGLHFSGTKVVYVNRMLAEEHYAEHKGKVFYDSLLEYITGRLHYIEEPWRRRVIAIVYQGPDAIKKIRNIAGPTNPHNARHEKPGCIRALGTLVPIKDEKGNVIGERMDNLIHASANQSDAEKEIKLWFTPKDIPPMMLAYPTTISKEYFAYKDGNLFSDQEPDSICLIAPGDIVWESDIEALRNMNQGTQSDISLNSVAAKYLINDSRME